MKLSKESVTKYCDSDTEAWTLAVGLSGRMFLASEGDVSYVPQMIDTKTPEVKKAAVFPTAASVFGTSQQSVFGSSVPPVFQFGSSKPVKLQFGSQDLPQVSPPPTKPFKFGSSTSSADGAGKGNDKEEVKKKSTSEKVRGISRLRIRRRRKSQSPVEDAKVEANEDTKEEVKNLEDSSPEEKDEVKPPESAKTPSILKQALSPAVAECQRAIFAAFLWQENLVYDAMASATYLKFRPELTKGLQQDKEETEKGEERRFKRPEGGSAGEGGNAGVEGETSKPLSGETEELSPALPPTLRHLVTFWDEISTKVTESSSLPFPSPKVPSLAQELQSRYEQEKKEIEKRKKDKDKKVLAPAGGGSTVCELCDQSYPDPVTYHMKDMHPGCTKHANGWGYNSRGTFCSGWAGNCGDGGRGGSTWYLLCKDCHARYIAMKDDAKKKTIKSIPMPKVKTKKPGKPRNLPVISAIQGMIQNAKFLLEISRSCDSAPPTPQLKSPSVSELTPEVGDLVRQTSSPLVDTVLASDKSDSFQGILFLTSRVV